MISRRFVLSRDAGTSCASNVGEDDDSPCDDDEGMQLELRKDTVLGMTCEEGGGKQTGDIVEVEVTV